MGIGTIYPQGGSLLSIGGVNVPFRSLRVTPNDKEEDGTTTNNYVTADTVVWKEPVITQRGMTIEVETFLMVQQDDNATIDPGLLEAMQYMGKGAAAAQVSTVLVKYGTTNVCLNCPTMNVKTVAPIDAQNSGLVGFRITLTSVGAFTFAA